MTTEKTETVTPYPMPERKRREVLTNVLTYIKQMYHYVLFEIVILFRPPCIYVL